MVGVAGELGSLLCSAVVDDSVIEGSVIVVWNSRAYIPLPEGAMVEPSVNDGSGGYISSANTREGLGCSISQGKIGRGFSAGGAGFSLGTSYHIFFGGLGYRGGGTNGAGSEDIS
jgi:hypothetical protein